MAGATISLLLRSYPKLPCSLLPLSISSCFLLSCSLSLLISGAYCLPAVLLHSPTPTSIRLPVHLGEWQPFQAAADDEVWGYFPLGPFRAVYPDGAMRSDRLRTSAVAGEARVVSSSHAMSRRIACRRPSEGNLGFSPSSRPLSLRWLATRGSFSAPPGFTSPRPGPRIALWSAHCVGGATGEGAISPSERPSPAEALGPVSGRWGICAREPETA